MNRVTLPNGTQVVATPVPPDSHLVRFMLPDSTQYDRMIVVTDHGDELHLAGWIGEPLTPSEWMYARDALFPGARVVRFERWCKLEKRWRGAVLRLPACQ